MLSMGLLAGYLARRWRSASGGQRKFVWKFAGVTVGAYVLHLFALLRSDLSHLVGAVLSPAVVAAGAAGVCLALPAARPRAWLLLAVSSR